MPMQSSDNSDSLCKSDQIKMKIFLDKKGKFGIHVMRKMGEIIWLNCPINILCCNHPINYH